MEPPEIFLLSTQLLPAGLIEDSAAQGIRLDAMAFIRTEMSGVAEFPGEQAIVVFTSQHAVEALPEKAGTGWKVYCIGGVTRKAVENRLGPDVVVDTAWSGAELAKTIIDTETPAPVIFFCGDQRRDELPDLLRQAGFPVEERIVYRTLPTPHRLEQEYAGVAFFSPSGTDSYFSVNPVNDATLYFAIGRTTAAAVQRHTGREAIVASKPDKESLIHEMITHFIV